MILSASDTADTATVASAWVAGISAVIAIVAVIVAFSQARAARDQARSAARQVELAMSQAESARAQADSAKRQVDAAVQQTELQERTHKDSHQPYVWTDIRPDPAQGQIFRLVVRNEGPTVAEDVRITFDPPLGKTRDIITDIDKVWDRLASGLPSLPPGREMVWYLAMGRELFRRDVEDEVPRQYTVEITGRGPYGELPPVVYTLDLDDVRETANTRQGSLDHVAKAVDKVAKALGGQK